MAGELAVMATVRNGTDGDQKKRDRAENLPLPHDPSPVHLQVLTRYHLEPFTPTTPQTKKVPATNMTMLDIHAHQTPFLLKCVGVNFKRLARGDMGS